MDNIIKPTGKTELAADAIGQGNVTFSALGMATVAAAIDSGVVRAPRLVAGAPDDTVPTSTLPSTLVDDLRTMMASVVTSGTASRPGPPSRHLRQDRHRRVRNGAGLDAEDRRLADGLPRQHRLRDRHPQHRRRQRRTGQRADHREVPERDLLEQLA